MGEEETEKRRYREKTDRKKMKIKITKDIDYYT